MAASASGCQVSTQHGTPAWNPSRSLTAPPSARRLPSPYRRSTVSDSPKSELASCFPESCLAKLPYMARTRTKLDGCGIAHATDLLGQRWALLVVRELILGPKRF